MSNISRGLKMPLMKYRFRIVFGGGSMYELQKRISSQVECFSLDMVNSTVKIIIRQTAEPGMINIIQNIVTQPCEIFLEPLDGTTVGTTFSITLSSCKCIDHKFDMDYADSESAKHIMTFKYDNLLETLPVDWEQEAYDASQPPEIIDLGKKAQKKATPKSRKKKA